MTHHVRPVGRRAAGPEKLTVPEDKDGISGSELDLLLAKKDLVAKAIRQL